MHDKNGNPVGISSHKFKKINMLFFNFKKISNKKAVFLCWFYYGRKKLQTNERLSTAVFHEFLSNSI